ncbi:FAD-binding oxidoreductase [Ralstonia insidiosa]|jgi:FAD/FMN-containing dehydrogenase|uniref:FAD-binding oxidoreductase n=1 Tax=Ralstonia TaxID=48736 RepID=UPI000664AC6D|nr:FAD-binding oxidoreductase [Ralstonia insidiosa]KMW47703.1 2-hydroxyacid dehydrogenase [Ralstonia sp. MD27]MBX3775181.1 FAD-binding oxidoreductase [Ralstonia pickettii]NOZ19081.1 FAD-binding oxidoreductase [Betaproteobacteria bacterium]MBA9859328.1 FAD-binding oxidoreductase [Ralstonia insidiosa]MBA9872739.1 FAD-binding oxidoreductase [Ralstonia insidiosa]
MTPDNLIPALRDIVGAAHVLTGDACIEYETDWRQRLQGKALCVVRPGSTAEVAEVMRACAQAGVSIVPQGGNTGLVEGSVPSGGGQQVILSLRRMQAVRAIDLANMTVTVEAGCVLQSLQEAVQDAGMLFPLSLGAEGSCTIGGNLATNAGGTQVVRYGNARELCLGLEVVLADGQVWEGLQGLRKDNTGYDLRNLFIGSEGTLGIITAATLRLYPQPAAQLTAWAAVPSLEAATALLALSHRHLSSALTGFEVMNQEGLKLVDEHYPHLRVPMWRDTMWCVLLEASDSESEAHARAQFEHLLETAMEDDIVTDAIIAENLRQAHDLWHIRESITLAQAAEGLNIKHDVSVPISCIPEFVAQTDAQLQALAPGVRLINFGHLGDGNLHYNMQAPAGADAAAFIAAHEATISDAVYQAVHRFGGSISAEHGIGALKRDKLPHYKTPVALQLMRTIKQALDPQCLLNPGRVLAAEPTQ